MKIKLSIVMFLEYFVLGAYVPVFTLYLKNGVGLSGTQMGVILSLSSIVVIISPIMGAFIANRIVSSERLFAILHILGAFLMVGIIEVNDFYQLAFFYFIYAICIVPTTALLNSIAFQHLRERTNFGNIRLWGTVGWIIAAFTVWSIFLYFANVRGNDSFPLVLSACSSIFLAIFSLSIPQTEFRLTRSNGSNVIKFIPLEILIIFKNKDLFFITLISLLVLIVDKYYFFGMGPFLNSQGLSASRILPIMSLGQFTEVAIMLYLSRFIKRFGLSRVLLYGILAEIVRFSLFILFKGQLGGVVIGILFHGVAYAFFATPVFMYLDSHCKTEDRAGLHQSFSLLTMGMGTLISNIVAGYALDIYVTSQREPDYSSFWLIPLIISFLTLVIFYRFFGRRRGKYSLNDLAD